LPVKTELVICCPLTPLQLSLYNAFVTRQDFSSTKQGSKRKPGEGLSARGLSAITQLKKVFKRKIDWFYKCANILNCQEGKKPKLHNDVLIKIMVLDFLISGSATLPLR